MTGYQFRITNKKGDYFIINDFSDPQNFIALQEYPGFDVDVKNSEQVKEGQNGIFDFFSFFGKRAVTFSGVIVGETEADVETLKRDFLKVISLPPIPSKDNDGTLHIVWTDANGNEWQIFGKLQGYPHLTRGLRQGSRLLFNLAIKCKNPEIESTTLIDDTGMRGWQQGSYVVPGSVPAVFDIIYDNEVTVNNEGTVAAHTLITITGEDDLTVSNPYIINETTGTMFKVNIVLNGADESITIDSKNGTVIDQDGNDQSGLVDGLSEYILLDVGDNKLVYLSDESFGALSPVNTWVAPQADVTIKHRTTIN